MMNYILNLILGVIDLPTVKFLLLAEIVILLSATLTIILEKNINYPLDIYRNPDLKNLSDKEKGKIICTYCFLIVFYICYIGIFFYIAFYTLWVVINIIISFLTAQDFKQFKELVITIPFIKLVIFWGCNTINSTLYAKKIFHIKEYIGMYI